MFRFVQNKNSLASVFDRNFNPADAEQTRSRLANLNLPQIPEKSNNKKEILNLYI